MCLLITSKTFHLVLKAQCLRFVSYVLHQRNQTIQKKQDVFFLFPDSAFKQQRLPAWQPILTAGTVLPTFFVIGIAFIPVGIGLLYFSDEVKEKVVDYTDCNKTIIYDEINYTVTSETCASVIKKDPNADCTCIVPFTLDADFKV